MVDHQSNSCKFPREEEYLPIENHGIIGNGRTTALVGIDGRIDWFCYPHFDSPAVFASLLDSTKGGHWKIRPVCGDSAPGKGSEYWAEGDNNTQAFKPDELHLKQFYWAETNVLVTRFYTNNGVAQLMDYMPYPDRKEKDPCNMIMRRITVVRGKMDFHMEFFPAFDFARKKHTILRNERGATLQCEEHNVEFLAPKVELIDSSKFQGGLEATFTLEEGETKVFAFGRPPKDDREGKKFDAKKEEEYFDKTVDFWRTWIRKCTYNGRWREQVHRSALILKMLTFSPTGAVVSTVTCGLPEVIGEKKNYDGRYMWIRDTAFTIYALIRIGFTEEAQSFMEWLEERTEKAPFNDQKVIEESRNLKNGFPIEMTPIQYLYTIHGERDIPYEVLKHFEGYKGSNEIQVGMDLHKSGPQWAVYGELMDSIYLYNKYGQQVSYNFWSKIVELINWLYDHCHDPDQGLWSPMAEPKHYVYSKLQAWVAFDRAIRLADRRSFPAPREKWRTVRDRLFLEIMEKGWNEEKGSFVQSYGSDVLDASLLMMPMLFFMSPNDPRLVSTMEELMKPACEGGIFLHTSLLFRQSPAPNKIQAEEEGSRIKWNNSQFGSSTLKTEVANESGGLFTSVIHSLQTVTDALVGEEKEIERPELEDERLDKLKNPQSGEKILSQIGQQTTDRIVKISKDQDAVDKVNKEKNEGKEVNGKKASERRGEVKEGEVRGKDGRHAHKEEGTWNVCSFWLIEALTRAGSRDPPKLVKARNMFDEFLGHSNHLGIFAESTGPRGQHLGNFPNALTHLAQISAAFNLNRALK
eukprot:TRINITY_DN816_c0_g1_i1.p1 TRINITY_DN816_c0_g1~~TRINITY_DN816_c0_g1_i1.p1  ORF type:complete len:847 (-),score=291.69 TRINITY_DN816_c0_g1_i1:160-2577(-)